MRNCYSKLLIVTLLAMFLRYMARDFISSDMEDYLLPWYTVIKNNGGLLALSKQVGDYGLLYQTIIALFTYLDVNPVYLYKILSTGFDIVLAFSISFFVVRSERRPSLNESDKDNTFFLVYAYVLLLPTVVMNSSFWGQCDSIYTFFLLWSIWFLYKEQYKFSFFAFGLALSFKLQSILITPLFIYLYFYRKNFSLYNFLITISTFWLSGIIAYFFGRRITDGFYIYLFQMGEHKRMWMNIPSFWILVGDDYHKLHLIAIGLTFAILGFGLFMVSSGRIKLGSFENIIGIAVFVEWTCMLFLPSMHERYTYVLDLLLLMLSFMRREYVKYAFLAILMSTFTYHNFHFSGRIINSESTVLYMVAWLCYSYVFFTKKYDKDLTDCKSIR